MYTKKDKMNTQPYGELYKYGKYIFAIFTNYNIILSKKYWVLPVIIINYN